MRKRLHKFTGPVIFFLLLILSLSAEGQRNLTDFNEAGFVRDTVRPFLKRMENIHFSGYIQPQFQAASTKGSPSFSGGNFSEFSNSRFMLRRARLKVDYFFHSRNLRMPSALFTFQLDATERGVNARDVFLRLFEPRKQHFSLSMGLFARPFGYEVNLSSAYRETPERGRMSQILMPTERDIGAMASYESPGRDSSRLSIRLDAGVFNGPGLSSTTDFDSYKDLIARLTVKPVRLSGKWYLSGGVSYLNGGWQQATRYRYEMDKTGGTTTFIADSTLSNAGSRAPRIYHGGDVQLIWYNGLGKTEWRAEYWKGKQPGTEFTTLNPGALPLTPTYIRNFDGAFFYFLQQFGKANWELVLKYDWYDPNTTVSGKQIGSTGTNMTAADIRYATAGIGLTRYFTPDLKILAHYDRVFNESTLLPGFTDDQKDDVFTLRLQLRF